MKKKYFRLFTIIFGSLLLILIVANFGVNYWLKNNLPDYLKKNTDYTISYQKLDVELLSGNISAQGITVNNKNPDQSNILGLQGTIDSLKITRLGIYDAIVNKSINTKSIVLIKPILNVKLPLKNSKNKNGKNPVEIKNIDIRNGKIQIFKPNKKKILGLNALNLKVSGLELDSENDENNLPFGFDRYSIEADKVFFRPGNIYLFLADHIKTEKGVLNIRKFSFVPLLSYAQFTRYFPEKKNLINLKSSEAFAEAITFKDKKISLKSFRLENPNVKIYTTNVKTSKKNKDVKYDLSLDKLILNNTQIEVEKPNQTPLFLAGNLNLKVNKIVRNSETAKESFPFHYESFNLDGKNLDYYTDNEHLKIASAKVNPQNILLNLISLKSTQKSDDKNYFDVSTKSISLKLKEFKMEDSKLKLEIDGVLIDEIKGKIATAESKTQNKPSFLNFPLKIHQINLKNSDLDFETKGKPMALSGVNLTISDLDLNQNKAQQLLLKSSNYNFTIDAFSFNPSQFYKISANKIKISEKGGQISNFAMIPLVSRAQFIRMIPKERDLYDLKAQSISFAGNYDFLNQNKFINLSNLTLNNVNANIFRSKIPKDDETVKLLYSRMLRSLKFPVFVNNLYVKNSVLVYEEDIPTSDGPGKLLFKPFNMTVQNVNSAKMKGKPTKVAITINAGLMGTSPLHINWGFDVADVHDRFTIAGTAKNLPANRINPFIEPYLHIKATGLIKQLSFNFNGNPAKISGTLKMQHENLKIAILKKDSKEKNKLLSGIANIFIKSDSDKFPASVDIKNVERDNTKSFFNLLWKGLQDGLAQTLIGINYKKNVSNVKSTVNNAADAIKNMKSDVKEVKSAVNNVTEKLKSKDKKQEPKKGKFF